MQTIAPAPKMPWRMEIINGVYYKRYSQTSACQASPEERLIWEHICHIESELAKATSQPPQKDLARQSAKIR